MANKNKKERRLIKVEIPKEIWDAHVSFFNRRDIVGSWMKSIKDVINQINHH